MERRTSSAGGGATRREARPAQAGAFGRPVLAAVLDAKALGADPAGFAQALFEAGVDWIQLRERSLADESLFELARALVGARDARRRDPRAAGPSPPRVIVNKRVDIALGADADGVHLGFDALDPAAARRLLGRDRLIGASLHSIAEVEAAAATGLDYAHLAPIWDPLSKPASRPALGPDALERAVRAGIPLIAQGGLDALHSSRAIVAGAAGVAVTGILGSASEACGVASELRTALDAAQAAAG